jgi:putative PIN family toxin of toxin-antitoxin system
MQSNIRAVVDTNVLVSGLLWDKLPSHLIDLIFEMRFSLVISRDLIDELVDVLSRDKFTEQLEKQGRTWQELVEDIERIAIMVEPVEIHPVVLSDPDDDVLIATALATDVDCIVTGNRHLLNLGEYQRIPIYNVEQFLRLFDL